MQINIGFHRLFLVLVAAGCTLLSQSVLACVRPHVDGYDSIYCLKDGLAKVLRNDRHGLINAKGMVVVDPKYGSIGYFSEGNAWVSLDYKYGFINKTGTLVIPLKFDEASEFSEGLAAVRLNNKTGFIRAC